MSFYIDGSNINICDWYDGSNNTPYDCSSNILHLQCQPFQFDVAVITQNTPQLTLQTGSEHIYELDIIAISESIFKSIFYRANNFSVASNTLLTPIELSYISFFGRAVCNQPFSLIETIITNIENDLNITQDMFTPCSLINLNKLINSIRTIADLNLSNVTCSLSWSEIMLTLFAEFGNVTVTPPVILTVSVVFISPTQGVKPVIIKFNFLTTITLN
jgi:hypothetical protein